MISNSIYEPRIDDMFIEARALLAVGLDGNIVVLSVSPGNDYFVTDARRGKPNIRPSPMPTEPGLYEFRGYTAMEYDGSLNRQVVHRGQCQKVAC